MIKVAVAGAQTTIPMNGQTWYKSPNVAIRPSSPGYFPVPAYTNTVGDALTEREVLSLQQIAPKLVDGRYKSKSKAYGATGNQAGFGTKDIFRSSQGYGTHMRDDSLDYPAAVRHLSHTNTFIPPRLKR